MQTYPHPKSLFRDTGHPYYVVAPDYTHTSAGVRVMHQLVHALNMSGADAWIICRTVNVALRTPVLTQAQVDLHAARGRTPIAVYPEVVAGNPLQCQHVVRYILNVPGHLGGDTQYAADEILYAYDPYFVPESMNAKTLIIPTTDPEIMHPPDVVPARSGACLYARKYRAFGYQIDPRHADAMDLSFPERSLSTLAGILRTAAVLYCYEPSCIAIDAILCGCPVVYMLSPYMSQQPALKFFNGSGSLTCEIGCEPDADLLRRARFGVATAWFIYQRLVERTWFDVEQFIRDTQLIVKVKP